MQHLRQIASLIGDGLKSAVEMSHKMANLLAETERLGYHYCCWCWFYRW